MSKQVILLIALLLFSVIHTKAFDRYLYVNTGGGLNTFTAKIQNTQIAGGMGGTFNFGYSQYLSEKWGFQSGIGFQSFNAKTFSNYISSTPDIDSDGEAYHFRVNFKKSIEQQQAMFVDVPLGIQFRNVYSEDIPLLISMGGKISIPISANYQTSGTIVTSGNYAKPKGEVTNMVEHDFITDKRQYSDKMAFKIAYMAFLDMGAIFNLTDDTDLYAGTYFNYGLNNIVTPTSQQTYQRIGIYNGVFNTAQTQYVKPLSFGLKIGLFFHLEENISGGKSDLEAPKTKPVEIKLPTKTVVASKVIPRRKVIEVKDILDARNLTQNKKTEVTQPKKKSKPVYVQAPEPIIYETVEEIQEERDSLIDMEQLEDPFEIAQRITNSLNIRFQFGSDKMIAPDFDKIYALSEILKDNPSIRLRITGHTDNIGALIINYYFGNKRSAAVKKLFVNNGVSRYHITTETKAYLEPKAPNTSSENRATNRRVEISVERRGKPNKQQTFQPRKEEGIVND